MITETNFTEKFLKSADNTNIAINHYNKGRNEIVILAHGWYMCKDSQAFKSMSDDFFEHYDVITMDFRGHGKSGGLYTFTANEPNDLKAVVDYAKQHYSKVNLIGFSLGATLSIIHAAQHKDINKLIAVSAPVSFDKIENHFWRKEAFIPTIQKFELFRSLSVRPGNILVKKINPIDVIKNITTTPVLFLAGEKDPTIYPWHAQELYDNTFSRKALLIFEKDIHAEDLYINSREKFMTSCVEWLAQR